MTENSAQTQEFEEALNSIPLVGTVIANLDATYQGMIDQADDAIDAASTAGDPILAAAAQATRDRLVIARNTTLNAARISVAFGDVLLRAGADAVDKFFDVIDPSVTLKGQLQPTLFGFPIGEPKEQVEATLSKHELTLQARVGLLEKLLSFVAPLPVPITSEEFIDVHFPFENLLKDLAQGQLPAIDPLAKDWRIGIGSSIGIAGFELGQAVAYIFPPNANELLITGKRDPDTGLLVRKEDGSPEQLPILQVFFEADNPIYAKPPTDPAHPFSGIDTVYNPESPFDSEINLRQILVHQSMLPRLLGYQYDPVANNPPVDANSVTGGGLLVDGRLTLPRFLTDPLAFAAHVDGQIDSIGCEPGQQIFDCILSHPVEVFEFVTGLPETIDTVDQVAQLQLFVPNFIDDVLASLDPAAIYNGLSRELRTAIGGLPRDASIADLLTLIRDNTPSIDEVSSVIQSALAGAVGTIADVMSDPDFGFSITGSYGQLPAHLDLPGSLLPTTSKILGIDIGGGEIVGDTDSFQLIGNFLGLADARFLIETNADSGTPLPRVGLEIAFGDPALLPADAPQITPTSAGGDINELLVGIGLDPAQFGWLQIPSANVFAGYLRGFSPGFELPVRGQSDPEPIKQTGGIDAFARLQIPTFADDAQFALQLGPTPDGLVPDIDAHVALEGLNIPGLSLLPDWIFDDPDLALDFSKLAADAGTAIEATLSGSVTIFGQQFTIDVGTPSLSNDVQAASASESVQGITLDEDGLYGFVNLGADSEVLGVLQNALSFTGQASLLFNATDGQRVIDLPGVNSQNDPELAPGGSIFLDGELTLGGLTVSGFFQVQADANGMALVSVGGAVNVGPLELIDVSGVVLVENDGIAAALAIAGGGNDVTDGVYTLSGSFEVQVNTTGRQVQRTVPGYGLIDIPGEDGAYSRVHVDGDLSLLGINLDGTFDLTTSGASAAVAADASIDVGPFQDLFDFDGAFSIGPTGLFASGSVTPFAGNSLTGTELVGSLGAGFELDGNFQLELNTIGNDYARVAVLGATIGAFGFNASGSVDITADATKLQISDLDASLSVLGNSLSITGGSISVRPGTAPASQRGFQAHLPITLSGDNVFGVGGFNLGSTTIALDIDSTPAAGVPIARLSVAGDLNIPGMFNAGSASTYSGWFGSDGQGELSAGLGTFRLGGSASSLVVNGNFKLRRQGTTTLFVGDDIDLRWTPFNLFNSGLRFDIPLFEATSTGVIDVTVSAEAAFELGDQNNSTSGTRMRLLTGTMRLNVNPAIGLFDLELDDAELEVPGIFTGANKLQLPAFELSTGSTFSVEQNLNFSLGPFEIRGGELIFRRASNGVIEILVQQSISTTPVTFSLPVLADVDLNNFAIDTRGRFDLDVAAPQIGPSFMHIQNSRLIVDKNTNSFSVRLSGGQLDMPIGPNIDLPSLYFNTSTGTMNPTTESVSPAELYFGPFFQRPPNYSNINFQVSFDYDDLIFEMTGGPRDMWAMPGSDLAMNSFKRG